MTMTDKAVRSAFSELFPVIPALKTAIQTENGFSIRYGNGSAEISYGRPCDAFRALALLCGTINRGAKTFALSETPAFDTLTAMLDVSRGAVPAVETVKKTVRYLVKLGYNRLMLYTEDTFLVPTRPYFGYMRGAYTEEELKTIVAYAARFGMEVVPCIETLSHMENYLRWSEAGEVRNSERTLLCESEETYLFLEELLQTLRRCFTSDVIHIGMDEAEDLADGRFRRLHGDTDRFSVFAAHLSRTAALCRKYGFFPMMWCDMFFRIASPTHAYCDPKTVFPKEMADILPQDISLVYWDYSNNDDVRVRNMIRATRRLGRPVIYAGGVWTMNGFTPNNEMTFVSGLGAIAGCKQAGCRDVIVTMWGDNGGECPVFAALPGLALFAEGCYSAEVSLESVKERFETILGLNYDAFDAIAADRYDYTGLTHYHNASVAKQVLYSDVLMGLFDDNFARFDIKAHFERYAERMERVVPDKGFEDFFAMYAAHHRLLAAKCDMGLRLAEAYAASNKPALEALIPALEDLLERYKTFHAAYEIVWMQNNKPQGYECIDSRLGGMESRVRTAIRRIADYVSGKTYVIPELAEKRNFFAQPGQTADYPLFSMWDQRKIFSASKS